MNCTDIPDELPQFVTSLITSSGGMFISLTSIICVATITSIDRSLRTILLSLSLSNIVGAAMLMYFTVERICYRNDMLGFVTFTVTLSLSHLILLMLAELLVLRSRSEREEANFIGLISLAWIMSIILAVTNIVLLPGARIFLSTIFLLTLAFIISTYHLIIRKEKKRTKLQEAYQKACIRRDSIRENKIERVWEIKYFFLIMFSYVACTIPWVLNELREGIVEYTVDESVHFVLLIIYSLNFSFPSLVCIFVKYKQWKSTRIDELCVDALVFYKGKTTDV